MKVNPNYQEINVRKQEDDPQSILHFYKQMIQLRKQHECLIYGDFKLHLEDDQHIFAYSRNDGKQTALIINNFSREEQAVELPDFAGKEMEMILSNYEKKDRQSNPFLLSPYETVVYLL